MFGPWWLVGQKQSCPQKSAGEGSGHPRVAVVNAFSIRSAAFSLHPKKYYGRQAIGKRHRRLINVEHAAPEQVWRQRAVATVTSEDPATGATSSRSHRCGLCCREPLRHLGRDLLRRPCSRAVHNRQQQASTGAACLSVREHHCSPVCRPALRAQPKGSALFVSSAACGATTDGAFVATYEASPCQYDLPALEG